MSETTAEQSHSAARKHCEQVILPKVTAMKATSACMRVLGGYGLLTPYLLEHMYRIAPFMKVVDGATEMQRVEISRALQKRASALPTLPIPGTTS